MTARARASFTPLAIVAAGLSLALLAGACGSNEPPPPPPAAPAASGAPKPPPPPAAAASASASGSALPVLVFNEGDFTESDSNRDPFHDFGRTFLPVADKAKGPDYVVVLEKYGIDELKLVAIVNSGDGARAMFVDPHGKGWTVMRGMHLGRGENVKLGTGSLSSYPLYWKIDRIKDNEVVLVREDSLHPEVAPTYREIPLHVEGEKS
jgi:type IV pilus assembly protein PilP